MRWLSMLVTLLVLAACGTGASSADVVPQPSPTATVEQRSAGPSVSASIGADPSSTSTPTLQPTATGTPPPIATAAPPEIAWSYPIGLPGRVPGDGFFIRHGYAVENTWFNPGDWHTGEDWYVLEGDTAGASVLAAADGVVVYAGSDYPGRVIIVEHAPDLFSMYGHLDPALVVQAGDHVTRGDQIGTVLRRSDAVPNHLHFEIRTFLTTDAVNGDAPRYNYSCGPQCPPGPGYWPINASEHPSMLGWRNPTHVVAQRAFGEGEPFGTVVVASEPVSRTTTLWSAPAQAEVMPQPIDDLVLEPGTQLKLLDVWAGAEDTERTSAEAYQVWYQIELETGISGWVAAAVASSLETGSDGRPSSVRFNLYPDGADVPK